MQFLISPKYDYYLSASVLLQIIAHLRATDPSAIPSSLSHAFAYHAPLTDIATTSSTNSNSNIPQPTSPGASSGIPNIPRLTASCPDTTTRLLFITPFPLSQLVVTGVLPLENAYE